MQFISVYFLIFMSLLLIGYYIVPGKFRYLFLLACNILIYLSWITNWGSIFSIIAVTLITWSGTSLFPKISEKRLRRTVLIITSILTVGFLIYFKYAQFFFENLNSLFSFLGTEIQVKYRSPFMPIGISFFTFQTLSYVFDVYREKTDVEKNIFRYAAYATFFPTILSGPIERSESLLEQIKNLGSKGFHMQNIRNGMVLTIWGGYIKYVIVDRFAVISDAVFQSYDSFGTVILCLGAVCYTLQIYCDFISYSLIALGLGKMLGIEVTENFNAPYFARSVQEFWRRWHISLSTWFRDYVYIPLGGSRCSSLHKYRNLFITFLVSGLWHGANWTFIVWGMIHGISQIIGGATVSLKKRLYGVLHIKQDCFSFRLGQRMSTLGLVSFAWIFFRADSLFIAVNYIKRMISTPDLWTLFNGALYDLGLDTLQMNILLISFIVFITVDYLKYKTHKNIDILLFEQNYIFYCLAIILLFLATLVFGMYGPEFNSQEFIYFQF